MKSGAMSMSKGQKMRLNIMIQMSKGAEYILMAIKNYDATELYLRDILMVIWPYLALLCIALIILSVRLSERPLLANSMFYYKKYKTLFVIVVDLAIMLFIYAYELEMYQTIIVLIALLVISICMLFSKRKIIY